MSVALPLSAQHAPARGSVFAGAAVCATHHAADHPHCILAPLARAIPGAALIDRRPNGSYRVVLSGAHTGSIIDPNPDIIYLLPTPGATPDPAQLATRPDTQAHQPAPLLWTMEDHMVALALEESLGDLHRHPDTERALLLLDSDLTPWGIGIAAELAALRSRPLTLAEVPQALPAFHAATRSLFALLTAPPSDSPTA